MGKYRVTGAVRGQSGAGKTGMSQADNMLIGSLGNGKVKGKLIAVTPASNKYYLPKFFLKHS